MITELQHVLSLDSPEFNKYHIIRHGSMVLFLDKPNGKLMMRFNPFDKTVFICDRAAIHLAKKLGTKRFLVGEARKNADKIENAQRFPRDLTFNLFEKKEALDCSELKDDMVIKLTQILIKKSGFTPEKISEYNDSDDAYCRYNKINELKQNGTFTCYVLVGLRKAPHEPTAAITADVIVSDDAIDIYLRDEVMDLPCNHAILFNLARPCIHRILEEHPHKKANVFIRAAAGAENDYIKAGCSTTNESHYVIHGPATELANELDKHVKAKCKEEYFERLSQNGSAPASTEQTLFLRYGKWAATAAVVAAVAIGAAHVLKK